MYDHSFRLDTNEQDEQDEFAAFAGDDYTRGYQAAKDGKANYRHDRYWIDDASGAELCRSDVVKGIKAYARRNGEQVL